MADDPNRDLLPVKEGSCLDTCRSSIIDHRDRHAVCKLDRYQLEDRYLRMLDEVLELKKLSNTQEDKIKRLATKLMRVSATPRSCHSAMLDFHNDKTRHDSLELENAKLKDKITVLRSQILNHKITGRSPSRSGRLKICTSSGRTTCRSDVGRIRSSTSHFMRESDHRDNGKDARNYLARIEELEMERKEMISRIEDMEIQIAGHEAENQRQKVAENVEFIRVWRQMKLQNEQLATAQARNFSLEEQIDDLKRLVNEKTRNNKEITTALLAEKAKFTEMDEQLVRAKNSQLNLREKDEQIRDMMNEMKILHQHNAELIALSSKYSQAELENIELRKKMSEQLSDNQNLKSAFSNERANITALQAANEQLMRKLHELQRNIDSLTIQLKSLQSKNERNEGIGSELRILRTVDRQTSTNSLTEKIVAPEENFVLNSEICKKCCQISAEVIEQSKPIFVTQEVQTEDEKFEKRRNSGTEAMEKKSSRNFVPQSLIRDGSFQHDNGNLSREEMLKLLEQAQINTPLDTKSISRIRRVESTSTKNYGNLSDSRQSLFSVSKKIHQTLANDPLQILLILYKILREKNPNITSTILDDSNLHENENPTIGQSFTNFHDENNNTISVENQQDEYHKKMENNCPISKKKMNFTSNMRQTSHESMRENIPNEYSKNLRMENLEMRPICRMDKYTEMTSDCYCRNNETCNDEEDCGYACAQSLSVGEITGFGGKIDKNFKSVVSDISTSIQKTFDNIHISRLTRADDFPFESYKSWQRPCQDRNSPNAMSNNRGKFIIFSKAQCNSSGNISDDTAIRKIGQCRMMRKEKKSYFTNKKCIDEIRNSEDFSCICRCKENCGDGPIVCESRSYPMLITNDQGLLEIHIMRLQLTSMGSGILCTKENIKNLSLFVTWDIWNQEKAFTPSFKYPKFNFNSSSIYRLSRLFEFFDSALGETISFSVHVSREKENSCPVARACLSIKDILDYPQNKLHYILNFSSILPCSHGQDFGQLSLWIRLCCDFERLELFKKRKGISGSSSVSKKISKINTNKNDEKNIYRPLSDSQVKKQSISSDVHKIHVRNSNELQSESLRAENAMMGKEIFQSSHMVNENVSNSHGTLTITRTSKDSGLKEFTLEASTSALQRSPINTTSMKNEIGSTADSYLSISRNEFAVKRSDSSTINGMEDEATMSEENRNGEKKYDTGSSVKVLPEEEKEVKEDEKVETASINEFNNIIHNSTILSPRGSTSSVQDVGSVLKDDNWDQYRKRSMATRETFSRRSPIRPRAIDNRSSYPFPDYSTGNNDAVIIRIESLALFQKCRLLDDPEIHRLYVEFSFLGYHGVELETISVKKPPANTNVYFNYMRKFEIDEKEHSTQRNKIRAMMREDENPTIKFIIVSEPLLEEMETKECIEVGYAYFNIREHILRGRLKDVPLTITNAKQTDVIGFLKITLLGAEAIRRCMSHS